MLTHFPRYTALHLRFFLPPFPLLEPFQPFLQLSGFSIVEADAGSDASHLIPYLVYNNDSRQYERS